MNTLTQYCESNQTLEEKALLIARKLGTFTADDLHTLDQSVKEAHRDKRIYGVILKNLQLKNEIKPTGQYVKSKRRDCHGRPIVQWRATQP